MASNTIQDFKACEDEKHDLECPICLFPVKEAMELPCSHLQCTECVQQLSASSTKTKLPLCCPICKRNFKMSEIHRNTYADRMVRNLNVYCPQREHGCDWKGTISTYHSKHAEACEYHARPCGYIGCPFSSIQRYLDEHEENCEFRHVRCQHCDLEVKFYVLNDHLDVCLHFPLECLNEGCTTIKPRNEVNDHIENECEFTVINCTFHSLGCHETFERRKKEEHNQIFTTPHMTFMFNKITDLQNQNTAYQKELVSLKTENATQNARIGKQNTEIEQLKKRISSMETKPKGASAKSLDINHLLLRGADRWIRGKKINLSERNYAVWFQKIFDAMAENKLYKFDNVIYLKMKNEERKSIWWFSKDTGERDRVRTCEPIYEGDDGLVLLNARIAIYIETETLSEFSYQKNSSCIMLHPRQQQNICPMRRGICVGKDDRWGLEFSELPDDFYVNNYLVLCLLNP